MPPLSTLQIVDRFDGYICQSSFRLLNNDKNVVDAMHEYMHLDWTLKSSSKGQKIHILMCGIYLCQMGLCLLYKAGTVCYWTVAPPTQLCNCIDLDNNAGASKALCVTFALHSSFTEHLKYASRGDSKAVITSLPGNIFFVNYNLLSLGVETLNACHDQGRRRRCCAAVTLCTGMHSVT